MRPRHAFAAILALAFLAAPASALSAGAAASPAEDCWGAACELINQVCQRVGGSNCVGQDASLESDALGCAGAVCDAINWVCQKVGGGSCVGAATAADGSGDACAGFVCDAVNRVCHCLGSADGDAPALEGTVAASASPARPAAPHDPHCMGAACDAINRVCQRLFHASCVG